MRRFFLFVLFIWIPAFGWSYLTLDTNQLALLTNQVKKQTPLVVEPPYIPSSYLKTGIMTTEPPESVLRRLDVMYFVTIPIIFYLTLNIIQQVEGNFNQNWAWPLDDPVERNAIFMSTLMVPLVIAYKDYLYLEHRRKIDILSDFSFQSSMGTTYSIAFFSQRF